MTRVRLHDGTHLDTDVAAHTLIAMHIEACRRHDEHLAIAGHVIRLADIDAIVPDFMLRADERTNRATGHRAAAGTSDPTPPATGPAGGAVDSRKAVA